MSASGAWFLLYTAPLRVAMVLGDVLEQQLAPWAHNPVKCGAFSLLWQVSFGGDNAPLGGVAGSPTEWVLVPAYSERPWKSPEKGAHPLLPRSEESA